MDILKWLKAPLSCKLGKHTFSKYSDLSLSVENKNGHMSILCERCSKLVELPIDDIIDIQPENIKMLTSDWNSDCEYIKWIKEGEGAIGVHTPKEG